MPFQRKFALFRGEVEEGGGKEGRTAMEAATAAEVAFTRSSALGSTAREKALSLPPTPFVGNGAGGGGVGSAGHIPARGGGPEGRGRNCPAGGTRAEPGELRWAGPKWAALGRATSGRARPAAAERCRRGAAAARPAQTRGGGAAPVPPPAPPGLPARWHPSGTSAGPLSRRQLLQSEQIAAPCLPVPSPAAPALAAAGPPLPHGPFPGECSHRELPPTTVAQGGSRR